MKLDSSSHDYRYSPVCLVMIVEGLKGTSTVAPIANTVFPWSERLRCRFEYDPKSEAMNCR